jgi:hypothetical protein
MMLTSLQTAETYIGKIVVEDIRVKANVSSADRDNRVRLPRRKNSTTMYMRDATGWQLMGRTLSAGQAGEPRQITDHGAAVLVAMTAACLRHGYRVTVTIGELCN